MANDNGSHSTHSWHDNDLVSYVRETPGIDTSRRSVLTAAGASILGGLATSAGTVGAQDAGDSEDYHRKTRPTVYTAEMRQNAQDNIQQYDWAANQRDNAVETADGFLERYAGDAEDPDLDMLWSLPTSQEVPRDGGYSHERSTLGGFSNSGTERLWKMETSVNDPNGDGNFVLPTNDFEAYRQSGLNDEGKFDPDAADDSLLVNEEHPEMGEGWGVDDGSGWLDENDDLGAGADHTWHLVGYYNHWFIWRPGGIRRMVQALTRAYLLDGDSKYAVAGLVVLDRIADIYPEMKISDYMQPDFWNNHGGRQTGRIVGSGWEGNLQTGIMPGYDAFFPALDDSDVADEVVAFLDGKTEEFTGLSGKDSVLAIRENIEENWIQEILPAVQNSNIHPGRGQRPAIALSARVQDDTREGGYTREALDWLFRPGGETFTGDVWNREPWNWETTGGELLVPVVDEFDRDGYSNEAALLYNRIELGNVRQVADTLQGYDGFDGADLYQHPKLRQGLAVNTDTLLLDSVYPEIGDTHAYGGGWMSTSGIQDGYEVTGSDEFAQLWHYTNGYSTSGIRGSIYDEDPEGIAEDIQAVVDAEGPLDLQSQNLAGYGFAALRDGENYLNQSFGTTYDTSGLFADASTAIDDSFEEAIQLEASSEGAWWEFEFEAESAGTYELDVEALFVDTYGIYELYVNGELIDTIDFMADGSGRQVLTREAELQQGTNVMRWENVGQNEESNGYKMALYYLTLLDEADQEIQEGAEELGNAKRAIWMYYGRSGNDGGGTAHGDQDALNVGVAANQMELSRDMGYPEQTGTHPKRQFFTDHTISHNTVLVDERTQQEHWVGTPRHFEADDERVNLIDVEANDVYPVTEEYRRTTAMITVDDQHSYGVDFFRVEGGDDHWFNFHGTLADVATEGLDLTAQDGGTLAGEDVPFNDSDYNDQMYDNGAGRSPGSGFNFFDNVERDEDPSEKVVVQWDVEDHFDVRDDNAEGVNMRLTSFGDFDEVALADGYPSKSSSGAVPEPSIRWAFLQRSGTDLSSDFVSTIEHWDGDRVVESVEEVPVTGGDANAVKVELTTGRTDYVVCSFDDDGTVTVDDTFEFEGYFGVYSVEDGESEYAYVHDGTKLQASEGPSLIEESHGEARGWVEDFTTEMSLENELSTRIAPGRKEVDRHAGFVYVDNDNSNPWRSEPDPEEPIHERSQRGVGNGAYPIEGLVDGNGNRMTIDVGDKTFLRDFTDPDQLEDGGYEHIIAVDDDLRIPLTSSWSWPEVEVSGLAESGTHPSFEISSVVPLEITGFSIETTGDLAAVEETERPHSDRTHNVFVYQAGIAYESEEPIQLDGTKYEFDTTGEVTDSRVQLERFSSDSGISLEGVVESREEADLVVTFVLADGTELPVCFDATSGT